MDSNVYDKLAEIGIKVEKLFKKMRAEGALSEIENLMQVLTKKHLSENTLSLELNLNLFSPEKEAEIELHKSGLFASPAAEDSFFSANIPPMKFLLRGKTVVLPAGYCPSCWQVWSFHEEVCNHCKIEVGKDVILIQKAGICPHCGRPTMSENNLNCRTCGYEIDFKKIKFE